MGSISPLAIGEDIEVDSNQLDVYTFSPVGYTGLNVVDFMNASGLPDEEAGATLPAIGQPRLRFSAQRATAVKNGKVVVQTDAPVLALTSPSTQTGVEPAAARAYNPIAKTEFYIPKQAGVASLQRLYDIHCAALWQAMVRNAVVNGILPY